jgi:hypothetical protein
MTPAMPRKKSFQFKYLTFKWCFISPKTLTQYSVVLDEDWLRKVGKKYTLQVRIRRFTNERYTYLFWSYLLLNHTLLKGIVAITCFFTISSYLGWNMWTFNFFYLVELDKVVWDFFHISHFWRHRSHAFSLSMLMWSIFDRKKTLNPFSASKIL